MQDDIVLIVEDESSIRDLLGEALRAEGYEVLAVPDGAEAVRVLDERRPPPESLCLVLLDMMLPGVDGVGVLDHLAELGTYVPVVAMSASRDALADAVTAGARETLPKPFDLDRLLAVVARNCPGRDVA